MRILALVLLVGCAAEETVEPPAATAHAHGYRHHAKPNPDDRDTSADDQARATQQMNDEMAREAARTTRSAPTASPTASAAPNAKADPPDRWTEHQKECRATFSDRMQTAFDDFRSFESSKAKIVARCKGIEPKCVLTGDRHVLGCKGVSADDASFMENVCAVLPQVLAIDESKDCVDVDKPVLQVRYGQTRKDVEQGWLDDLKQENAALKAQIEARDAKK